MLEVEGVVATDSGMCVLWNPECFRDVVDYETWEATLLEDDAIRGHIVLGCAVPVNIGADGAFQMNVRAETDGDLPTLTERESRYIVVTSDPYLFVSDGIGRLTGLERVGTAAPDSGLTIPLPSGRWSVVVHLIAWDEEPGARGDSGRPATNALPDFILLLSRERGGENEYRQEIATFRPPTT